MSEPAVVGVVKEPVPLRNGIRRCLLVFCAFRAGVLLICAFGVGILPRGPADAGAATIFTQPSFTHWQAIFTALQRNDANWYLRLATTGYHGNPMSPAFFPGYPLAIRAVSLLTGGHPLLAATVVSNLSLLAALIFLYSLTAAAHREHEPPLLLRAFRRVHAAAVSCGFDDDHAARQSANHAIARHQRLSFRRRVRMKFGKHRTASIRNFFC